jgi:hypothetical protein
MKPTKGSNVVPILGRKRSRHLIEDKGPQDRSFKKRRHHPIETKPVTRNHRNAILVLTKCQFLEEPKP